MRNIIWKSSIIVDMMLEGMTFQIQVPLPKGIRAIENTPSILRMKITESQLIKKNGSFIITS